MAIEDKLASSRFQVLGHRVCPIHEVATLVEWRIDTGRTHQIRRHAAAMGHPIVGDATYGTKPVFTGHGIHLHGTELAWTHPVTGAHHRSICLPSKKMKLAHHPSLQLGGESEHLSLFMGKRRVSQDGSILPAS